MGRTQELQKQRRERRGEIFLSLSEMWIGQVRILDPQVILFLKPTLSAVERWSGASLRSSQLTLV